MFDPLPLVALCCLSLALACSAPSDASDPEAEPYLRVGALEYKPLESRMQLSVVEQDDGSARYVLTTVGDTDGAEVEISVCVHPFREGQVEFALPSPALVSLRHGEHSFMIERGSLSVELRGGEGTVTLAGLASADVVAERAVEALLQGPLERTCFAAAVDERGERQTLEDPEWASSFCSAAR